MKTTRLLACLFLGFAALFAWTGLETRAAANVSHGGSAGTGGPIHAGTGTSSWTYPNQGPQGDCTITVTVSLASRQNCGKNGPKVCIKIKVTCPEGSCVSTPVCLCGTAGNRIDFDCLGHTWTALPLGGHGWGGVLGGDCELVEVGVML